MCLPYPLPSHCPACGCQEDRSLAVPIPHAFACLCTLSGPLFIQAPRFTRWYGWFRLHREGNNSYIKRHRVAVTWMHFTGGWRSQPSECKCRVGGANPQTGQFGRSEYNITDGTPCPLPECSARLPTRGSCRGGSSGCRSCGTLLPAASLFPVSGRTPPAFPFEAHLLQESNELNEWLVHRLSPVMARRRVYLILRTRKPFRGL